MKTDKLVRAIQIGWTLYASYQQTRAWRDAQDARVARERAEAQAAAQTRAMLEANPSGQLGHAKLNDEGTLKESGLL